MFIKTVDDSYINSAQVQSFFLDENDDHSFRVYASFSKDFDDCFILAEFDNEKDAQSWLDKLTFALNDGVSISSEAE